MYAGCSLGNHRYLGPSRHTKKEKKHEQYRAIRLIFGLGERCKLPQWGPGEAPAAVDFGAF